MLGVTICVAGVAFILLIAELFWREKVLRGELRRKFVHIAGGVFVASWPGLVDFRTIQIIGILLLIGVLANRYKKFSNFTGGIRPGSYGDILSAVAIIACATLTDVPLFFAIAILHLAVADGLAAVIGSAYGKKWKYKILGQQKTLIGTMSFWLASVCILGIGLPFAGSYISFEYYIALILVLPPALTILENISILGTDNIVVPLAALAALEAVKFA